jgi:hypothetical protein
MAEISVARMPGPRSKRTDERRTAGGGAEVIVKHHPGEKGDAHEPSFEV